MVVGVRSRAEDAAVQRPWCLRRWLGRRRIAVGAPGILWILRSWLRLLCVETLNEVFERVDGVGLHRVLNVLPFERWDGEEFFDFGGEVGQDGFEVNGEDAAGFEGGGEDAAGGFGVGLDQFPGGLVFDVFVGLVGEGADGAGGGGEVARNRRLRRSRRRRRGFRAAAGVASIAETPRWSFEQASEHGSQRVTRLASLLTSSPLMRALKSSKERSMSSGVGPSLVA